MMNERQLHGGVEKFFNESRRKEAGSERSTARQMVALTHLYLTSIPPSTPWYGLRQ
jgi:hypothetical protein